MEIINVGANPNDSTGDKLRDCFIKVNSNFVEINAKVPKVTISTVPPVGVPADGEEWVTYTS